jgi:hypothetical protein
VATHHDPGRRKYEEAVLAALDFEPSFDPFALTRGPGRLRRVLAVGLLAGCQMLLAVTFADALASGPADVLIVLIGLAWLLCTAFVVLTVFRLGSRGWRPFGGGWRPSRRGWRPSKGRRPARG